MKQPAKKAKVTRYKPTVLALEKTNGPKVNITQMQLVFYEVSRRHKSRIMLRANLMLVDMNDSSPPTTIIEVVESTAKGTVAASVGELRFVRGMRTTPETAAGSAYCAIE